MLVSKTRHVGSIPTAPAMLEFKDKSGRLIREGDYIIYGHALGRCAGLRYGKVIGLKTREIEHYGRENEIKVKIQVQGVDDDWNHREASLCKKSYLEFSERILKIDEDQIPKKYLELLTGVSIEKSVDPGSPNRMGTIE